MGYFRMSYRVLYSDTMALGWHHFLTNFTFQCEAREHYFFGHLLNDPAKLASVANVAPVTNEGYSRNLGQVPVGGVVGVLVSYEDAGPCSVRFCFRVVRADGVPVSCGYQKLVTFAADTGAMIPAPEAFRAHEQTIREKLVSPSFSERVASGVGLDLVFDEEVIRLGMLAAAGSREGEAPRPLPTPANDLVFTFPGTGSVYPELLAEIAAEDPSAAALVREAGAITESVLGAPLEPLLSAAQAPAHLERHPDLVQPVCFLGGALTARMLLDRGFSPSFLMGHSLGEIAALSAAGAFPLMTGVQAVAARAAALRPVVGKGGMVALVCTEERARSLIAALGSIALDIAVLNGPEQTVVSGSNAELDRLDALAAHLGIRATRLNSAIPFHNRMLKRCVDGWSEALSQLPLSHPRIPVYSPLERDYYHPDTRLAKVLPGHFIRPLAFDRALTELVEAGGRTFIECGGGNAVSGIGRKLIAGRDDVTFFPTFSSVGTGARNLARAHAQCRVPASSPAAHAPAAPAPLGAGASPLAATPAATPAAGNVPVATVFPPISTKLRGPAQIAVVGMGCVLPGAHDPAALWKMVLGGQSAVAAESTEDFQDYLSAGELPVPDKTYSKMRGRIEGFRGEPATERFATSAQRYLGAALAQSLSRLKSHLPDGRRMQLVVGSTADGVREYEDALLTSTLAGYLEEKPSIRKGRRARQLAAIEIAVGRTLATSPDLSPWQLYDAVARQLLGEGVRVRAVDAACASSLYAVSAAVRSLGQGDCDLALAGGVFTPGAANSCLFAQFRGLSRTGSRPLDVAADGVVFSEGAGILALKRLDDALAAGDEVLGVIQGVGLSSDGKSPSVMEPREAGQLLALRRSYQSSGIDPATIEYLEAHATATVVGDAVEVKAAAKIFNASPRTVRLGSVKANFGHTGWAAGVTSLIKMICAMRENTVPPQALFQTPSPKLQIEKSVFQIATAPQPWPAPGETPRRVAVNGFGFGGANAHIVMEAPPTPSQRAAHVQPAQPVRKPIAVCAIGSSLPAKGHRFAEGELELPSNVRILPDILDHMDRANVLAVATTARTVAELPNWKSISEDTGVALGIEGKVARGLDANMRVHRDRVQRRLREYEGLDADEARELRKIVDTGTERILPSGPYTLPGLMPNVVAGRVTSAFDFRGPNLVVDAHRASLPAAIEMASSWISNGDARAVVAGALHGHAHPGVERLIHASASCPETRPVGEAAVLLMLTTVETANELGWPIHAVLSGEPASASGPGVAQVGRSSTCLLGAEGALELIAALADVRAGRGARTVAWASGEALTFRPAEAARETVAGSSATAALAEEPVQTAMVELVPTEAPAARTALAGKRFVVVTDRALPAALSQALAGASVRTVVPLSHAGPSAGQGIAGDVVLDLSSEAALATSLEGLAADSMDHVLVVRDLTGEPEDLVCEMRDPVSEAAFAVARKLYDALGFGAVALTFLNTGAWTVLDQLHPATGLSAGLAKSLAAELPSSRIRAVNTDGMDADALRGCLERELAAGVGPVEVAYRRGQRLTARITALPQPTVGAPLLHAGSIVLAVGGARGVTAVLVEGLLERFGCTVALMGRSDPAAVPASMVDMSESQLAEAEGAFLAAELSAKPRPKPAAVKARWERMKAAREVALTLRKLEDVAARAKGRVVYVQADVTDGPAVDDVVARITRDLGKVDFVLFGAGVQHSKLLSKRSLDEFRQVLGTKLGGLGHVTDALERHQPGNTPHVHLVSSATGLMGAPGAQDYAAANEVLNRLALCRAAEGGEAEWGSVAWTWWRGVGMGTAFDQLPAAKRLPSISREQGKELFVRLCEGRPVSPVVSVYMPSDAELMPEARIAPASGLPTSLSDTWQIDKSRFPYLTDHLIDGAPTMPGANLIDLAIRSAMKCRPGTVAVRAHNVRLMKFVKALPGRPVNLRAVCRVAGEEGHETFVHVRLVSDFIHANGTVLRRDEVHSTVTVVLSSVDSPLTDLPRPRRDRSTMIEVPEPYQAPGSRVFVGGPFHRIGRIWANEQAVESSLRPAAGGEMQALTECVVPVVLLDALFRITTFEPRPTSVLPVFVPTTCTAVYLPHRKIDPREPLSLEAGRRFIEGNLLRTEWAEARDHKGRVVLRAENLVGLKVGFITVTLGSQEREELP